MARLSVDDFDIGDVLGEGSFGSVCQATLRSTGIAYAVKIIDKVHAKRHGGLAQVKNEKDILIKLDHPNIIRLHSTFADEDQLYIVLEHASGGELFQHIKRLGACHLSCARWLAAELVNALEYMHSKGVLHRDLKPENILLDEQGHIKLVDFGSARHVGSAEQYVRFVGTAEYVSPEVLDDCDATEASDLWALGCILFQMLSGAPPFRADSEYLTFKRIEELDYSFPEAFPEDARLLVNALLQTSPSQRLGAGFEAGGYPELKAHPFFTNGEPLIDFSVIHTLTPPPLLPPPPMPRILGDMVCNDQLAKRLLRPEDRRALMVQQMSMRYAKLLRVDAMELIVLATTVLKHRHLSCRRRQLVLCETMEGKCRLFYLDLESWDVKGSIPWSEELHAELFPRAQFRIHVPGRTYYLTDSDGNDEMAERWVRTITELQARHTPSFADEGPNSTAALSSFS